MTEEEELKARVASALEMIKRRTVPIEPPTAEELAERAERHKKSGTKVYHIPAGFEE